MSISIRFRRLQVVAALLATVAVPVNSASAQIVAAPTGNSAVGPRQSQEFAPSRARFAGDRDDVRPQPVVRDATIHLSTVAIVIGVVILVLLLV